MPFELIHIDLELSNVDDLYWTLCNQSFLNENACSGDESSAKVLFEHPSTTLVYTKT